MGTRQFSQHWQPAKWPKTTPSQQPLPPQCDSVLSQPEVESLPLLEPGPSDPLWPVRQKQSTAGRACKAHVHWGCPLLSHLGSGHKQETGEPRRNSVANSFPTAGHEGIRIHSAASPLLAEQAQEMPAKPAQRRTPLTLSPLSLYSHLTTAHPPPDHCPTSPDHCPTLSDSTCPYLTTHSRFTC